MKLQQLRFLAAVVQNDLNLTAAANKLATTQPAVSKQLKSLEDELGFRIFISKFKIYLKFSSDPEGYATRFDHVVPKS